MKSLLFKCPKCCRYTMEATCQACGELTALAAPARYSPDDRYARYRSPLAYESAKKQETSTSISSSD